jgi:hypothetical protein
MSERSKAPDRDLHRAIVKALTESGEVSGEGFIFRLAEIACEPIEQQIEELEQEIAGLNVALDTGRRVENEWIRQHDLAKQEAAALRAEQAHKWARLLLERDNVQGRKVLERMIEYYEEHDGKADDFGRLFIVTDALAALGEED